MSSSQEITKGGVYRLDNTSSTHISILTTEHVSFFDSTKSTELLKRKIEIGPDAKVDLHGLLVEDQNYDLEVITAGEKSVSNINYVIASRDEQNVAVRILSQLSDSHCKTDVHILSLVADKGVINLDGIVQIDEGIEKVEGEILEENIFLGSSGSIKGIPSLMVRSNDVKAGHSARIERVSDEKMYYLRSRGIPKDDATVMMIRNAIADLFSGLQKVDEKMYEDAIEQALGFVL